MFSPLVIGLRGGHSPNCKGAMGHLDEQATMKILFEEVEKILKTYGHTVINCCSTKSNKSDDLYYGTNLANNKQCDIFVSLHMNASNGKGYGVEAWTYKAGGYESNKLGERLCENFAKLGYKNRGVKHNSSWVELHATKMPAVIFETCFCDNVDDVNRYNSIAKSKLARYIANAIDPVNIPLQESNPPSNNGGSSSSSSDTLYVAAVGGYSNKANAENMLNELKSKGFSSAYIHTCKK